jgi:polysaccharide export outer membrane protein
MRMLTLYGLLAFFIAMTNCSCESTKKLTYMQGSFDTAKYNRVPPVDPLIQKGDLLTVVVYSENSEATRPFNQLPVSGAAGVAATGAIQDGNSGNASLPGYLVDDKGNIEFQGLGLLHVDGLTRSALKDTLDARLEPFLTNPYYSIRFLNYRITMLGEVTKPGIYTISGDRVNIFQALGMAGDMTFFGRRDNVMVIREMDGKREFARLDLTKPEVMGSPFFYLQQNDIVIFDVGKTKVVANDQTTLRDVSIATALISTFAILYTIFR